MRPLASALIAISAAAGSAAAAADARDVTAWMTRVGERVQQYYARAQSIICEETVRLQPLGADLLPNGDHVRELVYELRVAWDAAQASQGTLPEATVLRQLLTVDGRPPRPGEEPGCFDRKPVSPEPLGVLLPNRQTDYVFTWKGQGRQNGRASVTLEYKAARPKPADVVWKGDCVSVDLPGRTRGRVWLDVSTTDVLRLDEELTGQFEVQVPRTNPRAARIASSFTIERADSSTLYRPVTFHDPDETVMLPASITSLQVIRNSGVPRLRTHQRFSKYRRFITGARIVQQ
jgi:hypothetical protein